MKPRSVPVAEFAGKQWRLHNADFAGYFIVVEVWKES